MGVNRLRIIVLAVTVVVLGLAACSRHDSELPTQLDVQDPPPIRDLTVSTQDNINFDVTWSVDDPALVNFYTLYTLTLDPGTGQVVPELTDTTATAGATFNTGGVPVASFTVGVASVTFENVEGVISFATSRP